MTDVILPVDFLRNISRIADALEKLANNGEPVSPDLVRPIEDFSKFEWESINASVVRFDSDGPTHVEYDGAVWTRRSPQNKYDSAIFFSRANGKDAEGNVKYLRLITFKTIKDADPLPPKAAQAVNNHTTPAPTQPPLAKAQPAPAATGAVPITLPQYYAESDRLKILRPAADAIAAFAGVKSGGDYSFAFGMLDYFAKAKAAGMNFEHAKKTLLDAGDAQKAIQKLPK
ncbi:MAG: single-stranded DNA-binding protein [Anaerolineaceae bacterium]|nr:single-stranded DNA-binding protein [Anaerolineaceae bacterium]